MTRAPVNGDKAAFPATARDAARLYIERGLAPVPLPHGCKKAVLDDWPNLRIVAADLAEHFPAKQPSNIGILNGEPSGNLADVDLDCRQARRAAALLLPDTGWTFGRKSAQRSHWLYRTDSPLSKASEGYENLNGKKLVELRGTGGQTVAPPSVHEETGEPIKWHRFDEPARVELAELRKAVAAVAAAALTAQHWPEQGSRQAAALALAGGLLRAGWTQERVETFTEAVCKAARDEEAGKRVDAAAPTADKLNDGKSITGWPKLAELLTGDGAAAVQRVRDWLNIDKAAAELVIPEEMPWPAPLAEEAFYGLAGEAVRVLEPASESDPAALLFQLLVGFGNVIGRGPYFAVEADRHYPNEFLVLIGRTSKGRKGTSWGQTIGLLTPADPEWADRIESGLSSGEGLIWAVRDPITKRERVKEGSAVRYEEVESDPGVSDKRLLVFEPELANVLKQVERQGNTLSAVIRQAWDTGSLRTLTKNTPARSTGAHISLIGHITAEELKRYLSATETCNGFANRFLWVCVDRSKLLPEGGVPNTDATAAVRVRLTDAVAFARGVGEVRRDDAAREIWRTVYGDLSEGRPGLTGALLGRAEAHVMRLAMLYALLDHSAVIGAPHLLAALALWNYVEQSIRHIFSNSLGDPFADELLQQLRSCPDGMTRWDITNALGRNQSAERIGRALGLLLRHKLARRERQDTGGRPAEKWYAAIQGQ